MRLGFAWAHGVAADDCIEPLRKTHLIYERGGETLIFVGADGKLYAARMQFVHCVHESGISLTMAREIFAIIFKQRSEERRVGKEGVSTCRSRGAQYP